MKLALPKKGVEQEREGMGPTGEILTKKFSRRHNASVGLNVWKKDFAGGRGGIRGGGGRRGGEELGRKERLGEENFILGTRQAEGWGLIGGEVEAGLCSYGPSVPKGGASFLGGVHCQTQQGGKECHAQTWRGKGCGN